MSTSAAHPINLQEVFFVRHIVVAVPGHDPTDGKLIATPENNLQVHVDQSDPTKFQAVMRTIMNPKLELHAPYQIDVECVGTFVTDGTLSPEDAMRGVTITANSVLFGAIREAISWTTARQVYGPLMLGLSVLQHTVKE